MSVDLDNEVIENRNNSIGDASKLSYKRSIARFFIWLVENEPQIVSADFMDQYILESNEIEGQLTLLKDEIEVTNNQILLRRLNKQFKQANNSLYKQRTEFIKNWIANAPDNPPANFNMITPHLFVKWLVSLRKPSGEKPGSSTYGGHRAGLFNLFKMYKVRHDPQFTDDMETHFRGLKRTTAKRIANGDGDIKIGKDPMDFGLYKYLGDIHLSNSSKKSIFSHLFLVLCWNLMCRAGNCASVCHSHMEWKDDSLCVYFAHMKNDQNGERPRDPRHIYANPLCPEICPILSL